MKITKRQLSKVVNNYLNEDKAQLDQLMTTFKKKGMSRTKIIDTAYKAGILKTEAVQIINSLEYYMNSGKNIPTDKHNLGIAKQIIRYMGEIYDLPEERKLLIMKVWENFGRHVVNPAAPLAIISAAFGAIGLSFFLFLILELAWATDRDLYYKLADIDKHLMHVLTLGSTSNFTENLLSLCKKHADKLILYSAQMYIKDSSPVKETFEHKGTVYKLDGQESSKVTAKRMLKSLIYDISFAAAKKAIEKTVSDVLSQDPEALRKKEKESIEKSGGTTAAKFNVLDNL